MNFRTYTTKDHWCSIDAHAKNEAVTVKLSLLPIKAANTSSMHYNHQVTCELSYLQDHRLLTLHWHSSQGIVHSTSAAVDICFHPDLTLLVVFLLDWDSALWQSWAAYLSRTVHSHMTKNTLSEQRFIAPAIHLFMNRYSHATYRSPVIYL